MEREAEAGTSSEKHKEMSEKRTQLCDFVEHEEEEEDFDDDFHDHDHNCDIAGNGDEFVPGPLLSLKDQIEKDKVFPFFFFLSPFWICLKDLEFFVVRENLLALLSLKWIKKVNLGLFFC